MYSSSTSQTVCRSCSASTRERFFFNPEHLLQYDAPKEKYETVLFFEVSASYVTFDWSSQWSILSCQVDEHCQVLYL